MEYTELDVWKETRSLVKVIYQATRNFPESEQYVLSQQIRRCAISIPSNIAEGCGRRTSADTIHFLHIARGSLYELETQLYLALDLNIIEIERFNRIMQQIIKCKKLVNGFINYYKSVN